uniref:ZP domain-containing protein n=1 Tax=Aceria tosichella TaxID=561515 RepID=A0A6G1S7G2_9ACAR
MTATRLAGDRLISRQRWPSRCGYIIGAFIALCLIYVVSAAPESSQQQVNSSSSSYSITSPASQQPQNLQSISKWLRLGSSQQRNGSAQAPNSATAPASGVAVEVSPPPSNMLFQYLPANRKPTQSQVLQPPRSQQQQQPQAAASTSHTLVATANRNTKLELTDQSSSPTNMLLDDDSDQFNLFVSNTCERDFMLVRVRTSRPFYGVIHTLNYRRKPRCSLEGDGALDYQLNISHALDSRDPAHCGVIKLRKQSEQGGEPGELLSVVLAIRVHRNVELSDDKFLVLNCTK